MDYLYSFLFGGLLCAFAQILIDKTKLTPARILVGYVCAGVVLSAIGLYQPFLELAKSGASVPLTGFGHLLAEGVRHAVDQYGLLGAFMGGLTGAAAGIGAAIFFGYLFALIFNGKSK